jgi:hypothetical protein
MNTMKVIMRILATLTVVLTTSMNMNGQRKDKAIEQQVF